MAEFQSDIAGVASAFANVSTRATAAANAEALRIAQGNVRAAEAGIQLEETTQRRQVARALAEFEGQVAAASAFRGGGQAGSTAAVADAATASAADQAAIIEANAAAKSVAAVAANQVRLEDPVLAGIQGAIQGLGIGTDIARALIEEGELATRTSSSFIGGGTATGPTIPIFENTITSVLEIPGFNLGDLLDIEGLDL
jgi:hypothetical protein